MQNHGTQADSFHIQVWGRALLLFTTLVVVKGLMVLELDEHLFQTHWRTRLLIPNGFDYLHYALFPFLGFLSLHCLARHMVGASKRGIIVANLWILGLGLTHVCLSFYEGDFNYLYPLMEGVIDGSDLWAYMSMNLFFRPPWLFVWLFSYALIFWICIRSQKPRYLFYCTGLMAGFYFLLNQKYLLIRGDDLLLVNCIGIGCLIGFKKSSKPYNLAWFIGLLLLISGLLVLFRPFHWRLDEFDPFFRLLATEALVLVILSTCYAWRFGFLHPWTYFVPFYFGALFLFTSHHYPYATNYNHFLYYILSLPHILFEEIIVTLVFFLLTKWFVHRFGVRGQRTSSVLLFILVFFALADYAVLRIMNVRLDWDILMMADSIEMGIKMAAPYAGPFLAGLLIWILIYSALIYGITKPLAPALSSILSRTRQGSHPLTYGLLLLALTGLLKIPPDKTKGYSLVRLAATSPWMTSFAQSKLTPEEFAQRAVELEVFPDRTESIAAEGVRPEKQPLNVFLIILESMYNKHLSLFNGEDETQPMLKKYRERMEIFPLFFGNYPTSNHARITSFTSLYGTRRYLSETDPRIPVQSLFEILHAHGYVNALFDSCALEYAGFRDFIAHRKVDILHDPKTMPGKEEFESVSWGLLEECTRDAIIQQFEDFTTSSQPFFLTYLPVAPHYPYDHVDSRFIQFEAVEKGLQGDYTGQYKNQLLYMDWILTSLLDALEELGLLENTLVVITNDHGEMLGDNEGKIGHGWSLEPDLTNLPLIILDPRKPGYKENGTLGSHVDLMPTILDLVDIPLPKDEFFQGVSLFDTSALEDRIIYLNSHSHTALIKDGKYFLNTHPEPHEAAPATVYDISRNGHRTLFTPSDESASISEQMKQFRTFQESLLLNYGYYKKHADEIHVHLNKLQ